MRSENISGIAPNVDDGIRSNEGNLIGMRTLILTLFIFIFAFFSFSAPSEIEKLQRYFQESQFDKLKNDLPDVATKYPDNPIVLFLQGVLEKNPQMAMQYYRRVLNDYPTFEYADHALFRLGQYSYFEQNYQHAKHHFSRLARHYPESDLKDDAQYLYCQCLLAQGKKDSAKTFLKIFVQNAKRSPFVDLAVLDIERLGGIPLDELHGFTIHKESDHQIFKYTIQVGAFKNLSNAERVINGLDNKFPFVEMGEKTLGNTVYHLVWIGKFKTKNQAREYARNYIAPYIDDYRIVERIQS